MPNQNNASTLLNIESLIHSHNQHLETLGKELKIRKNMLDNLLEANEEYRTSADAAAKATKIKTQAKQKVLVSPEGKAEIEKIKDMQSQSKELKLALSDYLSQYVTLSGTNQIESPDGSVYDIVYNAHLSKKSKD
jgi:hypothetical protein